MALYLPIRAVSRSQRIRVGTQTVLPTATTYVDISDTKIRRALNHHQAIGAVITVGGLSASNADVVVDYGAFVDQGSSGADLNLAVSAGELHNRATGAWVAVASSTTVAVTADGTHARISLVVADNTTGAVSVVAGTPATTPVAPAVPAGKTALASVAIGAAATGITNANITDLRPRP